jgi:hypothetical protein
MFLHPSKHEKIRKAQQVYDLASVVGMSAFYIVVPCQSIKNSSKYLNGTRITGAKNSNGGWDLSICSASTQERFVEYEEELHDVFQRLIQAFIDYLKAGNPQNHDKIFKIALELFYYWVNFAPVSRGTSATGYASLYAAVLASGHEFTQSVPKRKQLDWEALLRYDPHEFTQVIYSWFSKTRPTALHDDWFASPGVHNTGSSPVGQEPMDVSSTILTMRDMINILSIEEVVI